MIENSKKSKIIIKKLKTSHKYRFFSPCVAIRAKWLLIKDLKFQRVIAWGKVKSLICHGLREVTLIKN